MAALVTPYTREEEYACCPLALLRLRERRPEGLFSPGNQIADGDDEHQVRNAAIAVFQTEAFKFFAEIFHMSTYLLRDAISSVLLILPERKSEVYRQSMNNVQEVSHLSEYGQNCGKTDTLWLTFRKKRI